MKLKIVHGDVPPNLEALKDDLAQATGEQVEIQQGAMAAGPNHFLQVLVEVGSAIGLGVAGNIAYDVIKMLAGQFTEYRRAGFKTGIGVEVPGAFGGRNATFEITTDDAPLLVTAIEQIRQHGSKLAVILDAWSHGTTSARGHLARFCQSNDGSLKLALDDAGRIYAPLQLMDPDGKPIQIVRIYPES